MERGYLLSHGRRLSDNRNLKFIVHCGASLAPISAITQRRLSLRFYLGVEKGRCLGEISEKSRTQPSLYVQVSRVIPISTTFCSPPIEPILVTGERIPGEDQREPFLGVGDAGNDTINPGI